MASKKMLETFVVGQIHDHEAMKDSVRWALKKIDDLEQQVAEQAEQIFDLMAEMGNALEDDKPEGGGSIRA